VRHIFLNKKRNKYGAISRECDGYKFASIAEYKRYLVLRDRLLKGEILGLEVHPFYRMIVNGVNIGKVVLDFRYHDIKLNQTIIEDVKGLDNALSKWKRKHVEAEFGIKVELIK